MRIAFDMSSVMWTCLRAGKDAEFGQEVIHNEKKVWVNGWQSGYENAINKMVAVVKEAGLAPKDCILVFEGMSSKKQRLMIASSYKESREDKPKESYEQFQLLKDVLSKTWRDLGALLVEQDFAEGDDTLAWLAKHAEEDLIIATNDNDMAALVGMNAYGARIQVWVDDRRNENKFGPFPHKLITVYKALVGDSSDNIKGCPGFGEAAFLKFVNGYGIDGLHELHRLMELGSLDELAAEAESDSTVKKIYSQAPEVLKSYRLAKLYPEWVNTQMHPLKFKPGMTKPKPEKPDERLAHWYGVQYLVTANKFDTAVEWARPFILQTPEIGLDIETSTPDESDDWLAAQSKSGKPEGVDVIGSKLTGLSLTFGPNLEKSLYFPVDHKDTNNCTSEQIKELVLGLKKTLIIQNALGFELVVLMNEWGEMLPDVLDTRIEAAYVDENDEQGLKHLSMKYLHYRQTSYEEVTTINGVQHKMNQLTGQHVLSYGCDDTITASALHNFFKLHMQLEHHWQVYLDVEIDSMYASAKAFVDGCDLSLKRLNELSKEDDEEFDKAWAVLREFLISKGWEGTVPPTYTKDITAAQVKEAYAIATGDELETSLRKIEKLAALAREAGHELFAQALLECVASDEGAQTFTQYVRQRFKGEPIFKVNSPKQKAAVLYDLLALPVRLRGEITDNMRAGGVTEGNPKANALAMAYALKYDIAEDSPLKPIISALQIMQLVQTRRGLYWHPYPGFVHWKTGKVHPSIRQTAANTRRAIAAKPNVQQVSKHAKAEGETPRVREVYVPHHSNAVIVSMDEDGQELRIIADYSKDPNMVACFVGDKPKKMHGLTGLSILKEEEPEIYAEWTYEQFMKAYANGEKEIKEKYNLGKKVNFTTEYGAQAPKLAETLIVFEEVAQKYIDAKEATFPIARAWKNSVEEEAKTNGCVRTKMGAVRHLAGALMSTDRYEASKALRQAVNFKVQSSSAEQIKRAIGAMWRKRLMEKYDCVFLFPVHDEVVWSVGIPDLIAFLQEAHACMVQPYGGMEIPIVSSIAFGKSFGPADQVEIGTSPDPRAITAGIKTVQNWNPNMKVSSGTVLERFLNGSTVEEALEGA